MPTDETRHRERMEIVNRIYDAVVHPEKTNDFVAAWDRYISEVSEPLHDRRNATGPSDVLIEDNDMEMHFARAYTLLERLGRDHPLHAQNRSRDETGQVVRLSSNGHVLNQSESSIAQYGALTSGNDVARLLTPEAAELWKRFLQSVQRAPTVDELHVFPCAEGGNLIAYNRRDEAAGDVHILVKTLNVAWTPPLEALLLSKFGLSNGELRLVRDLCAYGSLDLASKHTERSKNTLRSQLKAVFQKLNVNAQPDVIQTAAMLAHLTSYVGFNEAEPHPLPHWGEEIEVVTPDGVKIPVHLIGPDDGEPIVFIHGMLDGVAVNAAVLENLHAFGFRLISPIRPNFGAAEANADIANTIAIFNDQLDCVVKTLGLDEFLLLGHMSGAPFAYAAAQKFGPRVRGVINVSGGIPILSTKQFAGLARRQKAYAYTARYAPAMLPALLRIGVAQIDSADLMGLVQDMYRPGSPDLEVIHDPEIGATVLDGYRFAVRQGSKGFESDAYQVTRDWSDLLPPNTEVLLIHGHHDPAVDIETVKVFAKTEGYTLFDLPEKGQLIFYGAPEIVFDRIRSFADNLPHSSPG